MQNKKGFTLIELMIAIAIIAILTGIAVYIYSSQARQGRRADGINTLFAIALAEERYRSNNLTYGTLAQVWSGTTTPQGFYTLSVSGSTATAYTATATAQGGQANDTANGVSCTTLTLTLSAGTQTNTPAACWPK